jgi:hypothetical protein
MPQYAWENRIWEYKNTTQINIGGENGESWNIMELLYYENIKKSHVTVGIL